MLNDHIGQKVGYLQIGPSIANTMLELAVEVGGDPIILVGQDLAHTDGKTHAAGTHLTVSWYDKIPQSTDKRKVCGIQGGSLDSNSSLEIFLHCFEGRIHTKNRKVINTSLTGARIQGTEDVPLQKIVDEGIDLTVELIELKHGLFKPIDYDLKKFKKFLHLSLVNGEELLQRLKNGVDIESEIRHGEYVLFYFSLQYVWEGIKCGRDLNMLRKKAIESLEYALPMLEETYRKAA